MDFYRELAIEALEQVGNAGRTLFCQGKTEVTLHVVGQGEAREAGNYLTVHCPQGTPSAQDDGLRRGTLRALRWLWHESGAKGKRVLVAGLGNPFALCDALGSKTVSLMRPSDKLVLFCPQTQAQTGIPSTDCVQSMAGLVSADVVVVVDTLACNAPKYLCRSIQLSDAGIRPGEGVGKGRKALSRDTLGVPVLYVGVPIMSFAEPFGDGLCVIPQNIEQALADCAALLAECITAAVGAL